MKIRTKTLSVIALALILSAIANFQVLKLVVFPSFVALESESAKEDIQRVVEAVRLAIDNVEGLTIDYAKWDDTYDFVNNEKNEYVERNFTIDALQKMNISMVAVFDKKAEPIIEYFINNDSLDLQPMGNLSFAKTEVARGLLSLPKDGRGVAGILLTAHGPLIVASEPIVRTNGEGPAVGAFIYGRRLDDATLTALREQTRVDRGGPGS